MLGWNMLGCSSLTANDFQYVTSNIEHTNVTYLRTDKQYLLHMAHEAERSICLSDTAEHEPECLVHFSWLMTANQLLHLHVGTR